MPVVFLIDKDYVLQDALARVLSSMGIEAKAFLDVQDFLNFYVDDYPACMLLDMETLGLVGAEIQATLLQAQITIPIIFLGVEWDVPAIVTVMKQGALDCLLKPCNNAKLIQAIKTALEVDGQAHQQRQLQRAIRDCYDRLSYREKQVMQCMLEGKLNKVTAMQLCITIKTVEAHRASVMKKMQADSLASLVRYSLLVDLQCEEVI